MDPRDRTAELAAKMRDPIDELVSSLRITAGEIPTAQTKEDLTFIVRRTIDLGEQFAPDHLRDALWDVPSTALLKIVVAATSVIKDRGWAYACSQPVRESIARVAQNMFDTLLSLMETR